MKYFKGIITADWHLSQTKPRARCDEDWIKTQTELVNQVYEKAVEKDCDIFIVGDIFHSNSDVSFEVISIVQNLAKKLKIKGLKLYIICGNHDLLYHSSSNLNKSAVGVLLHSENIYSVTKYSEDVSGANFDEETENKRIVFKHVLAFADESKIPPHVEAITAQELLDEYDEAKFIFLGDNHHSFIYENKGRKVINSGCLIRRNSDFKSYVPIIYYVDEENDICESFEIIDNEQLIDDSYILQENEREERIDNFVQKLKDTESVSLDFLANVETALQSNELESDLKEVVEELLEV